MDPAKTQHSINQLIALNGIQIKQEPKDPMEEQQDAWKTKAVQRTAYFSPPPSYKDLAFVPRMKYMRSKQSVSPDTSVCEVCQAEFPGHQVLQTHKMCHFNTTHVCYVCDTYFVHSDTLILHMATSHRQLHPLGGKVMVDDRDASICSICLQRFSSKAGLVNHLNIHAAKDGKCFACKICGLDFLGFRALMSHLTAPRHAEMKVKIQSIFVCVDCRSIFASRDSYAMHMMLRAQNETCQDSKQSHEKLLAEEAAKRTLNQTTDKKQITDSGLIKEASVNPVSVDGDTPLNLSVVKLDAVTVVNDPDLPITALMSSTSSTVNGTQAYEERDSGEVGIKPHSRLQSGQEERCHNDINHPWKCNCCASTFESCDTLAMHMMTQHANTQEKAKTWQGSTSLQGKLGEEKTKIIDTNDNAASKLERPRSSNDAADGAFQRKERLRQFIGKEANVENSLVKKRSLSLEDTEVAAKILKNDQGGKFGCHGCSESFERAREWGDHVSKCKGGGSQEPAEAVKCTICDLSYESDEMLGYHLLSKEHNDRVKLIAAMSLLQCKICFHVSKDSQDLSNHYLAYHQAMTVMPGMTEYGERLRCKLCSFATSDKTDLADHYLDHSTHLTSLSRNNNPPEISKDRHHGTEQQLGVVIPMGLHHARSRVTARSPVRSSTSERQAVSPDSRYPTVHSEEKSHDKGGSVSSNRSVYSPEQSGQHVWSGGEGESDPPSVAVLDDVEFALEQVQSHSKTVAMCKHCKIIYLDKTVYYLHMGLHNLNNPWQCNMCGKVCRDLHEFSSHVIHYS